MGTLEEILGDELNVSLLRFLSSIKGGFSGNAIATKTGLNQSSVRKALERLVEAGIVIRTDVGRSAQYELDLNKAVTQRVIIPLFESEANMRYELIDTISKYFSTADAFSENVLAVILYGSLARGQRDWRDVDLLVIVANKANGGKVSDSIAELGQYIYEAFGVPLSLVVLRKEAFSHQDKSQFLQEISKDGICLYGTAPKPLNTINTWPDIKR